MRISILVAALTALILAHPARANMTEDEFTDMADGLGQPCS